MTEPTIYEHLGGDDALRRAVDIFYSSVLADPMLKPLFGAGRPEHVDHLTAFMGEVFGGPARYTEELGGFDHIVATHRGLGIAEAQRARFVELMIAAADKAGLPTDERFRAAWDSHAEFGSQVAMQNSNARSDQELHPLREMPLWTW
ncbi:group II truncated hemoglobin [Kribbella sp. NPDC026611]|uniref:group II truncated hemoglobin n=1 Tax=Kribbella sp. NPDC026611 TaxID=3154911 RepID=UPI0033EB0E8F